MSRDGSPTCGLTGSFGITGETLAGVNGHNSSDRSRAGLICTTKASGPSACVRAVEVEGEQSDLGDKHLWFSQTV